MGDYYLNLRSQMEVASGVFLFLTFILGVPGNACVLYVAGLKMKRTVNTVGFLNLSCADLLCCLSTLYFLSRIDCCAFGFITCRIFLFIMHITMFVSVFTLSLISLDRFTQVITPVWARNHRSLFIARLFYAAAWILALGLSLPLMIVRQINTDNNTTHCLYQIDKDKLETFKMLSVIRFVFGFMVPLMCITACYGFIARKLGRSHFHSGRAFRVMMAIIVAFFLCWLPYHTVRLMMLYGKESSVYVGWAVDPLVVSLAYFNSCLNPILYVFMGQDFKNNVKFSLRRVFERVFSEEGTQIIQTTPSQQMHSLQ